MKINQKNQKLMISSVIILVSLTINVATFWQLQETGKQNQITLEKMKKQNDNKLQKQASDAQAEREELAQMVTEKESVINNLKKGKSFDEGTVDENQVKLAEDFSRVAMDKSIRPEKMKELLKPLATQDVITKLVPENLDQTDKNQGTFNIKLGDVSSYVQTSKDNSVTFVVFIDYKISNPQFKDVKPQLIKGGVTVTETKEKEKWLVSDFSYFTR